MRFHSTISTPSFQYDSEEIPSTQSYNKKEYNSPVVTFMTQHPVILLHRKVIFLIFLRFNHSNALV